ncbi:MAG: succinate dehydrogenase/fumarate reductase flavoprotein subunit, partial [Ruminococcus sp.]|nr:succinate dehydrogenase/fumarate reductase flavoprotein subunit [Ruminococcus sp.]
MYKIDKLNELAKIVAEKRPENASLEPRRMTAEEKDTLLATFHPDYKQDEFTVLSAGVNKGEKVPTQLAELLQGKSRISASAVDLSNPEYDTAVRIIGGGGAGSSAAIEADEAGVKAMIV